MSHSTTMMPSSARWKPFVPPSKHTFAAHFSTVVVGHCAGAAKHAMHVGSSVSTHSVVPHAGMSVSNQRQNCPARHVPHGFTPPGSGGSVSETVPGSLVLPELVSVVEVEVEVEVELVLVVAVEVEVGWPVSDDPDDSVAPVGSVAVASESVSFDLS